MEHIICLTTLLSTERGKINFFWTKTRETILTKECVALSIKNCPSQDLILTDCVNDGSFVFARFLYIGCRLHWLCKVNSLTENQSQHTKLHHCSYITLSKLQHILTPICSTVHNFWLSLANKESISLIPH